MKRAEQAQEWDRQVAPADSRSTSSKVTVRCQSRSLSQCGSSVSSSSSVRLKAEMEQALLQSKAAALKQKLAIEKEEAEWHAEQRFREVQLQAEKKNCNKGWEENACNANSACRV